MTCTPPLFLQDATRQPQFGIRAVGSRACIRRTLRCRNWLWTAEHELRASTP